MRALCRLYWRFCKAYGPDGLTLSAYAWKTQSWWVAPIDALFALWGQTDHCKAQYLRETAAEKGRS